MTPAETTRLAACVHDNRITKGLSIHDVAHRAGLEVGAVTEIERVQVVSPWPDTLIAVAAVLGIQLADIFAKANGTEIDELPSFAPYMRAKNGERSDQALSELKASFHEGAARYGAAGPLAGEDEY